jgi:preprotein translocase SecE subunit
MIKRITKLPKSVIGYVRSVWQELKMMEWLSAKNTMKSTGIVILLTGITTLFIILADSVIAALRNIILNQ